MSLPESAPTLESLLSHSEWLTSLARRLVGDRATADDLVQDTWIAALRNPPREAHSLRAWLSRVARRLARGRGGRTAPALARVDCPPTDEVVARIEQERLLAQCVIELEEPYRTVVLLHFYRGLSAARIARLQGVPEASVRTRVRRALALLRERLSREGGSDHWEWLNALFLAREPGVLSSIQKGVLLMSTKSTVALGLASGALSALAVTEVILPRIGSGAHPALVSPDTGRESAALVSPAANADATSSARPDAVSVLEEPAERASGDQRRAQELSRDDLRRLLFSSKRIDQVRAIELLLQDESDEARRILLDAFLGSTDRVLLALLHEALLASPQLFAPAMLEAFLASQDASVLARLSGLLAGFAQERPELQRELIGHLMAALDEGDAAPDRAGAALNALVALGVDAADELGDYIVDRDSGPAGVGSAAWALAQLSGEHGALVRERLDEGLRALDLEQWGLSEEERAAMLEKTGSIAWAASLRPESEHDRLAETLLASLLSTRDPAQAGTLGWSLGNLKGLSEDECLGLTRDLLSALEGQADESMRQQYASALMRVAMERPAGPAFDDLVRLVQDARDAHGSGGRLAPLLERMLADLRARAERDAK